MTTKIKSDSKHKLTQADIQNWVSKGPCNEILKNIDSLAKYIAKDLPKKERVTTSQIRQVFSKMKAIEAKGGIKKDHLQVDFLMLKPQMAYVAGRHNKDGIKELKEVITLAIDTVLEVDARSDQQVRFKNFCMLFEAILSYHKAHDGS